MQRILSEFEETRLAVLSAWAGNAEFSNTPVPVQKPKKVQVLKSKYLAIKINGKKHDLHRYIFKQNFGENLGFDDVVHHRDGDTRNNALAERRVNPLRSGSGYKRLL